MAAIVALSSTSPALAQQPDLRRARELFDAAEKDEAANRWREAHEKLTEVAKIRLTPGVRYHLALCDERLGRLLAALEGYSRAEEEASAQKNDEVLRFTRQKLDELRPRIPQLTLAIPPGIDGVEASIDGKPIIPPTKPTQVDPGEHKVEARAPGRVPFGSKITLAERNIFVLQVSLLPIAAPPPSETATPPPPPPPRRSNGSPGAAIGTGIAALVLAGGGLAAFLVAGGRRDDAIGTCAPRTFSCQDLKDEVRAWDGVALGAWITAAVLAVTSVILYAGSRTPQTAGVRF
jgi:tetratricopeptide (TPR) repeat protein